MKKAVIISTFDNYGYDIRTKFIEKYFQNRNYETTIISANFDHRLKNEYRKERLGLKLVEVPEYKKNLSFKRMYSHFIFAKKSFLITKEINPEIIYVGGPPNSLFYYFSKYKKNNSKKVKIIYEVSDMWPETLPISNKLKKILNFPLSVWANLRNKYLKYADHIIFECEKFQNALINKINNTNYSTIYLCKEIKTINNKYDIKDLDTINLVYLGSINNIIDTDLIIDIINKISDCKKVIFHIIGDGEKKDILLKGLESTKAIIKYHGIIYNEEEKNKIFNHCHFALNIMKSSVCVGLTMKSIDYFAYGLPIINNISDDTFNFVEKYNCGFNIINNNSQDIAERINKINLSQIKKMKKNARNLYEEKFTIASFDREFDKIFR